jgi:hypothetical protein
MQRNRRACWLLCESWLSQQSGKERKARIVPILDASEWLRVEGSLSFTVIEIAAAGSLSFNVIKQRKTF